MNVSSHNLEAGGITSGDKPLLHLGRYSDKGVVKQNKAILARLHLICRLSPFLVTWFALHESRNIPVEKLYAHALWP